MDTLKTLWGITRVLLSLRLKKTVKIKSSTTSILMSEILLPKRSLRKLEGVSCKRLQNKSYFLNISQAKWSFFERLRHELSLDILGGAAKCVFVYDIDGVTSFVSFYVYLSLSLLCFKYFSSLLVCLYIYTLYIFIILFIVQYSLQL